MHKYFKKQVSLRPFVFRFVIFQKVGINVYVSLRKGLQKSIIMSTLNPLGRLVNLGIITGVQRKK